MTNKNLIIFDTTLRDGEQSPGASMDIDVEQYRVDENIKEKDLMPDFFC